MTNLQVVPDDLSAEEMAEDLGTSEVAALRLAGIHAHGLAYEVFPGRYRRDDEDFVCPRRSRRVTGWSHLSRQDDQRGKG